MKYIRYFAATNQSARPKISLLPVLSQIKSTASFVKVKISDFQTHFHDECALPTPARLAVEVENRSGLTFVHRAEAVSLSS